MNELFMVGVVLFVVFFVMIPAKIIEACARDAGMGPIAAFFFSLPLVFLSWPGLWLGKWLLARGVGRRRSTQPGGRGW